MSIDITRIKELSEQQAPLYCKYPGQSKEQPAYLELSEDGTVDAGCDGDVGGAVPMTVWNGRDLRYSIPSEMSGAQLLEFVKEHMPLLERIHAGHEVRWDGSNWKGCLNQDACDAEELLEAACEEIVADTSVWTASEWLFSNNRLPQVWGPDETLEQCVARIAAEATAENVVLDGDIEEELLDEAQYYAKEGRDGLTHVHLEALIRHQRIRPDEVTAYGAASGPHSSARR